MTESKSASGLRLPALGLLAALLAGAGATLLAFAQAPEEAGRKVVEQVCNVCHETGVAGAPRTGVREDWAVRLEKGFDAVLENAVTGFNGMPAKGGRSDLSAEQVGEAIRWMARLDEPPPEPGEVTDVSNAEAAGESGAPQATASDAAAASSPVASESAAKVAAVNTFNRLMRSPGKRNPPPATDGIHDPANPGTDILQHPKQAFDALPKAGAGNYVDWVAALENRHIAPRYDRVNPDAKPVVMDLNIVREVKGSMPDVVYPHKQHTEWLDCSNCHPAIFVPKKGENTISMAAILLGEKCGVCHGKVAFPVAECRRCHSRNKEPVTVSNTTN